MIQQVTADAEVKFGGYRRVDWMWQGDNSTVPAKHTLEVDTITLNYFPEAGGTLGRADLIGRDAGGTAVWRLQVVYVEPKKTRHLTFPKGLRLEAGGYVEIGFTSEGPGTIEASFNGSLVPK